MGDGVERKVVLLLLFLLTSQVFTQVVEWAFASDNSLDEEPKHGEHSETSILDFLDLELSKGIWVISQSKWVESLTRVEWVKTLTSWATVYTVSFNESHEDDIGGNSGANALGVDEGGVVEVVDTVLGEDESLVLEPNSLWEVNSAGSVEVFWDQASESTQHGPTGVDDFNLAVAGEGFWVSGKTGGVPAVVPWVFSLEVAWWAGEWAQELGALGTVPERERKKKGERRESGR